MDRFWSKVDRSGDCWEWTGSKFRLGYGSFGYAGRVWSAHRVAWTLMNGPIPTGLEVCHTCDNRGCVNPAHLFIGTHAENMADGKRKGRFPSTRGELNPRVKVSDQDVLLIREMRQAGALLKDIASRFGIGISHAHRISTGESR